MMHQTKKQKNIQNKKRKQSKLEPAGLNWITGCTTDKHSKQIRKQSNLESAGLNWVT